MDTSTFYTAVGGISFTLLGLWWVVVQSRESWRLDPARRRMAYAVSLHFVLPGAMSVLSLVAPDAPWLWRLTFTTAGIFGVIGAVSVLRTLREEYDCPRIARIIEWVAVPVYGLVALVAFFPEAIGGLVGLTALQIEGVVLAVLILLGAQVAWILMIEPGREAERGPEREPAV